MPASWVGGGVMTGKVVRETSTAVMGGCLKGIWLSAFYDPSTNRSRKRPRLRAPLLPARKRGRLRLRPRKFGHAFDKPSRVEQPPWVEFLLDRPHHRPVAARRSPDERGVLPR